MAYIAMNRFKVLTGSERVFEDMWLNRDVHLKTVPGFVEFHLLRGPAGEGHTLYASHTVWGSEEDFVNWTKSEAFREAHKNAGSGKAQYDGPPHFEGFETLQHITR